MSQTALDQYELSLTELLRGFMEAAHSLGKKNFPPFEDKLWHEFLYELKKKYGDGFFPILECIGPFDWDGSYPKCREFDVQMFSLRYICFSKFVGGRVYLDTKNIRRENPLLEYYPHVAHSAILVADSLKGFFEPR